MSSGPVIQIKIGDVIDPRTFWAHENKRLSKTAMKLRILESSLKDHISGLSSKVTIPTRPGSAVAVRHEKRQGLVWIVFKRNVFSYDDFQMGSRQTCTSFHAAQEVEGNHLSD